MISNNKIVELDLDSRERKLPHPMVIMNILSAQDFRWDKAYYFSGESHKHHEVVYVMSGEVIATEDDRIYHLVKGDLVVHGPYEFHRIATDGEARALVFSFDTSDLFPHVLYDGFFVLTVEEEATLLRLFEKIYRFYHGTSESYQGFEDLSKEIASALPAFFLELSVTHQAHPSRMHLRSEEEYRKIVETMRHTIKENLSLDDIASRNHVSVSYIKHLFHRYAGIGAKQYYTTLRLNEIIRLLEADVPVAEIARQLHFSSPEYLYQFVNLN